MALDTIQQPKCSYGKRVQQATKKNPRSDRVPHWQTKKTFNILHQEIRIDLDCVQNLIAACIILKNIILTLKIRERVMSKFHLTRLDDDGIEDELQENDQQQDTIPYQGSLSTGNAYRDAIALQFSHRQPNI
jgi:hypothetical protein